MCFLLQLHAVKAVTTTTTAPGAWNDATKWTNGIPGANDVVIINHLMDFSNINMNIGQSGNYTFNAGADGSAVPLALSMASASPAPVLNIYTNVSFAGGINLNGGTINVYTGAILTVTNQINQAGTQINVHDGANFNVTGNYTNNGGDIDVDGLVKISGNYDGQNSAATVTGAGNITTTGHMIGINNSSIFGVLNPNCSGVPDGCDGRNLSGSGCQKTATVTPSTIAACAGTVVLLNSSINNVTGYYSVMYQWQSRSVGGTFSNIAGATVSTHISTPATPTFYRVIIYTKQTLNSSTCTTFSVAVFVNVNSCNVIWVGGTPGHLHDWNTPSNWLPAVVPTSSSDVVISNSANPPILSSSGVYNVKNLSVENGAAMTINTGNVLNVYGNVQANGAVTIDGPSTMNFMGSAA